MKKLETVPMCQRDDFSLVLTSLLGKLYCPKYFSAVTAMYHQTGDIKILEVIRWGIAQNTLRNTVLDLCCL